MQDFTGVPAIVDLAAMRDAVMEHGGNPKDINLIIPIDLVIDHSIQVDYFKTSDALVKILRWGQQNFDNYFISSCIIVVKNTIFDIK
jgi:aconitate hydratase